jgi:hypothetical protein
MPALQKKEFEEFKELQEFRRESDMMLPSDLL